MLRPGKFTTFLKGTDHRLKAIRNMAASALPGKAIVVLDQSSKLITDIVLIEDGHAQERSEFDSVLNKVLAQVYGAETEIFVH